MTERLVCVFGMPVFKTHQGGCWAVRYAKRRWKWHHAMDCELKYL